MNVSVIDLAQPLSPSTSPWPGNPWFAAEVTGEVATSGYYARNLAFPEHTGTHMDAPAHFAANGDRIADVGVDKLVVPAAMIDISAACAANADYVLTVADIEQYEATHGRLAAGTGLLLYTGWDKHLGNPAVYINDLHFPGVGVEAATLLVERGIAGIGIDTLGIDPGCSATFPVHHITLPAGLWHLEGLVDVDKVPPAGGLLVIGVPKVVGASGMPCRPLVLVQLAD